MKLRVRIDDEIFEVEIGDLRARPIVATVAGERFEVWPEAQPADAAPSTLEVTPDSAPAAAPPAKAGAPVERGKAILAPIPGVILSIQVQPGDAVAPGQEVCVLEAMKMKNSIRANRAGTVAAVHVTAGEQVRHGQVLLEFTD